jgi:hypothetical protein
MCYEYQSKVIDMVDVLYKFFEYKNELNESKRLIKALTKCMDD